MRSKTLWREPTVAEDRISEVEDKMVEINEAERKKEKRIKRNEDNLRDNVKCPNIQIIGVPKEDKKKGHENILEEIIDENFPYRQAKAERIQHHQTSSSTNAKGSSLDRKHRKAI